jgi:hypothetical protein
LRVTNTTGVVTFAGPLSAVTYQSEAASVTYGGNITATVFRATAGAAAVTQTFAAASSTTVRDLYILGASGKTITLRSSASASWGLNVTRYPFVKYADVSYSDASAGVKIYPMASINSLNNQNWYFGDTWGNWTGASSTDFANSNNWTALVVPDANTRVVIDGGAVAPTITGARTVKSLALGPAQTATLTLNAPLTVVEDVNVGGYGTLIVNSPSVVSGSCTVVSGGTVTHSANAGSEAYKLNLRVVGNLVLDQGAAITANDKGYAGGQGPGKPVSGQSAASHGGRGGCMQGVSGPTYGSVLAPTNCGSGASVPGGGVVFLMVGGTATVHGTISANGASPASGSGGAGGSVWLTAGALAGSGAIEAKGGPAQQPWTDKGDGGGGRIAVELTGSENFGGVTFSAAAVNGAGDNGAPGTVYRQTPSQDAGHGEILIDSKGVSVADPVACYLMPETNSILNETRWATLRITNSGTRVKLSGVPSVADVFVYPGAVLDLTNLDLYVYTARHDLGGGTTNSVGGRIIWLGPRGSVFTFR